MLLRHALRVRPDMAVAFTGAGGKTSAIRRLAGELQGDVPLLISVTTRLAKSQSDLAERHLILEEGLDAAQIRRELENNASVLLTGPLDAGEGKWVGMPPPALDDLWRADELRGAVMLVEADGARGRSLKAPAAHEPALPESVDLLVPVVGLDVIGTPADGELVHRPERVLQLLGVDAGAEISEQHVVWLLRAPDGGLKGAPRGAAIRALLNKAGGAREFQAGRRIAQGLAGGPIEAAAIGAVREEDPIQAVIGRTAGIVLAAGGSERFGREKLTLEWRGVPLVRLAVQAAMEGGLDPVLLVVSPEPEEVRAAAEGLGARIVLNEHWQMGQSSSLRSGLAALAQPVEAAVFLLADMPFVDEELVRALVSAHQRTLHPIVAPRVGDRWGNPVLFDRATFGALRELKGDRGGRALFPRFAMHAVPWDQRAAIDIDRPEDQRWLKTGP